MDSRIMQFTPLKIRAYLQTPVISDRCLPLDGILFNHFVRERLGAKTHTIPRGEQGIDFSKFELPIKKIGVGDDWYYCCSFAIWPEHTARGRHEYGKRFDFNEALDRVDFKGKRGRVETSRGQFKNYWVKEYTWNCNHVDWYCLGDKASIENLLHFCTHIGKKSSQGCGSVLFWEVSYTEIKIGETSRAIPDKNASILYGIRPPYWLSCNQFICKMDGNVCNSETFV